MKKNPVFIIDCQTISPLGMGSEALAESLMSNRNVTNKICQFDPEGLSMEFACEVKQNMGPLLSDFSEVIQNTAKYDRKFELLMAIYAANKIKLKEMFAQIDPKRKGIIVGLGANVFPLEIIGNECKETSREGLYKAISKLNAVGDPNSQEKYINQIFNHSDLCAHFLGKELNAEAFQKTLLTACSSSTQAIAFGAASIAAGKSDLILVGGSDSILNNFAYISFGKLGVLTNGQCKPFDISRNGTIAGECAGYTVLASERAMEMLQIPTKFELIGIGNSLDGYKITAPDPSGTGIERAIQQSMRFANINPYEIDYINAHGTGTRSNDEAELLAIERVMGEASENILVSSTKDRHGHSIAAAGIQEFNVLLAAMENDFVPSNLNLEKPIRTNLLLPQGNNLQKKIKIGMTNNFAFGGINSSIIVKNIS